MPPSLDGILQLLSDCATQLLLGFQQYLLLLGGLLAVRVCDGPVLLLQLHELVHKPSGSLEVPRRERLPHAVDAVAAVHDDRDGRQRGPHVALRRIQLPHLAADPLRQLRRAGDPRGERLSIRLDRFQHLRGGGLQGDEGALHHAPLSQEAFQFSIHRNLLGHHLPQQPRHVRQVVQLPDTLCVRIIERERLRCWAGRQGGLRLCH
mmetsp:Transcript_17422/g.52239  ORF Transcript_17422/g.52239 Transcript_17422/m.52239 type:complete len:206 (-) Transcript_17422:108-725(-)